MKQGRLTLQFQIRFPHDHDTCYIAYAVPYTYSDLRRSVDSWMRTGGGMVRTRSLCKSLGGRDVPIVEITGSGPTSARPCIFLTARVHPGETNGSIVLAGLVEWLLSKHPSARWLVEHALVRIIPMLNPDGVIEGFYRVGLSRVDLNRVWTRPDPEFHPVIFAAKRLLADTVGERSVAIYVDFHGHSRQNGTFVFGCPGDGSELAFPRVLSFLTDAFSWGHCIFSYPRERRAASRIVARKDLGVQSYTVESSFGGIPFGPRHGTLYDETIWHEIGAKCGEAICHVMQYDRSPLLAYVLREIALIDPSTEGGEPQERPLVMYAQREDPPLAPRRVDCPASVTGPRGCLSISPQTITATPPGAVSCPRWSRMRFV